MSASDVVTLIVGLLGLIVAMIVLIVRQQRRREARLAVQTEIEIPIQSIVRSVLIITPLVAAGPVLVGLIAASTDQGRQHAVAAALLSLGIGIIAMFAGLSLSRRFARIGLLRYAPPDFELQLGAQRCHIDLDQPCELAEASAVGPSGVPVQVFALKQGDQVLAFSYGLPIGRKAYGDRAVARWVAPFVDGEARVVHDRIRRRFDR